MFLSPIYLIPTPSWPRTTNDGKRTHRAIGRQQLRSLPGPTTKATIWMLRSEQDRVDEQITISMSGAWNFDTIKKQLDPRSVISIPHPLGGRSKEIGPWRYASTYSYLYHYLEVITLKLIRFKRISCWRLMDCCFLQWSLERIEVQVKEERLVFLTTF